MFLVTFLESKRKLKATVDHLQEDFFSQLFWKTGTVKKSQTKAFDNSIYKYIFNVCCQIHLALSLIK